MKKIIGFLVLMLTVSLCAVALTFREYLLWAYDQDRDGALNQQEYDHYLSVYGIWDPDIDIPHP